MYDLRFLYILAALNLKHVGSISIWLKQHSHFSLRPRVLVDLLIFKVRYLVQITLTFTRLIAIGIQSAIHLT